MTRPVSIVVPSLDDIELFRIHMPRLLAELDRRGQDDEVLVVDDTGRDALSGPLGKEFPQVRVVTREENGGFAVALRDGIEAARHQLVFSMNPDVRIRAGFLDPLIAALDDPEVAVVVPQVLLDGDEGKIESLTEMELKDGLIEIHQPGLDEDAKPRTAHEVPVAFAVGGTSLFRREEFLERGGFDPLFAPFYWEDVDWCWYAWRAGRRVAYVPTSIVEHHHRGTIGRLVPKELVRAAQEKNRLLFHWKYLDSPQLLERHTAALYRLIVDAWLEERRDALIWLNLALAQLDEVLAARSGLAAAKRSFEEIRACARPEPEAPPSAPVRKTKKKASKRRKR